MGEGEKGVFEWVWVSINRGFRGDTDVVAPAPMQRTSFEQAGTVCPAVLRCATLRAALAAHLSSPTNDCHDRMYCSGVQRFTSSITSAVTVEGARAGQGGRRDQCMREGLKSVVATD